MTGLVDQCYGWHGDTKSVYETAYGKQIGVHDGDSFLDGHFLHSACTSNGRRASSKSVGVEFKVSRPFDVNIMSPRTWHE